MEEKVICKTSATQDEFNRARLQLYPPFSLERTSNVSIFRCVPTKWTSSWSTASCSYSSCSSSPLSSCSSQNPSTNSNVAIFPANKTTNCWFNAINLFDSSCSHHKLKSLQWNQKRQKVCYDSTRQASKITDYHISYQYKSKQTLRLCFNTILTTFSLLFFTLNCMIFDKFSQKKIRKNLLKVGMRL